jgi:hypothetical protein
MSHDHVNAPPHTYLVLGPESSGTRLTTQILLAGGCQGSAEHRQPMDEGAYTVDGPSIVWRRSVPHHIHLPHVPHLVSRCPGTVSAIVCKRDPRAVSRSQLAKRTAAFAATLTEMCDTVAFAEAHIAAGIRAAGIAYTCLVYEDLLAHPAQAQTELWCWLGLPGDGAPVAIRDENAKHLAGGA